MGDFKVWAREQWSKSNIISGVLALAIWTAIIALAVMGRELPDALVGAGGLIIGFFFNVKRSAE